MNIFIRLLFLSFLFIGCENSNNDILDSDLEKEFRTAIANTNAEEFKYLEDGLVPQESFFIDSKLKYLKFRFNPEAGFSERRVYFDLKTDSIERIVLRKVQADWDSFEEGDYHKFHDSIFVVYPKLNKMDVYFDNEKLKSLNSKGILLEDERYIYRLKKNTESQYNKKASN
ncbi:hypothetical protein [Flavobacterium cheniae]|uniref:Lipoprotein n=1 Tax=Flavobacterium cheniae TaxID=295428 RepID=A0A562KJU9_9FLAO|nr:hypothetical protein [Flavobacterium cheniae]TDR26018.1 hypothetical protein C8D80_0809 [Flavobacterium cheniae]TWH95624.1 hypothetical protein IP97_01302 [Flavobacterium cheniae]